MRRRGTSLLVAAACVAALLAFHARAQTPAPVAPTPPAPGAPQAPEAPPEIAPIPIPEIAAQADVLTGVLREIEETIAQDPAIAEVERRLPAAVERYQSLAEDARISLRSQPSLDVLEDLAEDWRQLARSLAGRLDLVTLRAHEIEEALSELDLRRQIWKRTREQALSGAAPPAVFEQIDSAISGIRALRKRAQARRSAVLTLQTRIAQQEASASELFGEIDAARATTRSRLLERDAPALWTAQLAVTGDEDVLESVRGASQRKLDTLFAWARYQEGRFAGDLFVFAAALALLLVLRRPAAERAAEDASFAPTARVFEHPYAAASIVAIAAIPSIHPRMISSARELVLVLLLVPMLRLLPALLGPALRSAVWMLAVVFLLDRLAGLARGVPLVERTLLGVETVAAAVFVAALLRRGAALVTSAESRSARAVTIGLWIGVGFLVVSLAANVLGYVTLARLLSVAPVTSAYLAVLFFAGVRIADGVVSVALRTPVAQALGMVSGHESLLLRRTRGVVRVVAAVLWAWGTLDALDAADAIGAAIAVALSTSFEVGTVSVSLGQGVYAAAALYTAVAASRFVRFVLEEDVYTRLPLRRGVPQAISTTVHYALVLLGFVLALGAAGIEFGQFSLLTGALGIGVGFGLQNVVNNFVSGLILLYERPVQVGDTIQLGELIGEVKRLGIRSSTVRTPEGADVIVPNGSLISDRVVNWTRSDLQRRIDVQVGVAYGTDPEKVRALLLEVAKAHPLVIDDPEPVALFRGFGDSSLDFQLRCWTDRFESFAQTRSEIGIGMYAALNQAGIEIPFPQRDLHVRSVAVRSESEGG